MRRTRTCGIARRSAERHAGQPVYAEQVGGRVVHRDHVEQQLGFGAMLDGAELLTGACGTLSAGQHSFLPQPQDWVQTGSQATTHMFAQSSLAPWALARQALP